MGIDIAAERKINKSKESRNNEQLKEMKSFRPHSTPGESRKILIFFGTCLLILFAISILSEKESDINDQKKQTSTADNFISSEEYGNDWPFTIPSGTLNCVSNNVQGYQKYYVSISNDGNTWAVNGSARGKDTYRPIEEIWRNNPDSPGSKISANNIIKRGQALCNKD